jgi:transcriptional regulator with XRE-family HTH domain
MPVAEHPCVDAFVDAEFFPTRLRQLRMAAGLTQAQLADRAKLTQAHVSNLEKADGRLPTWETVIALANALGVSCEAFRKDPAAEPAPPTPRRGRPRKPTDAADE